MQTTTRMTGGALVLFLALGQIERHDVTLVLHRVETRDVFHDVLELAIFGDAIGVLFGQLRHQRRDIVGFGVGRCVDAVPRQRVILKLLAGLCRFHTGRHQQIWRDAFPLSTATVDAVELLNGVLD